MPFEVDEIEEGITDQHTCFSDNHAIIYLGINDAVVDHVIQTEMSYANHDTCIFTRYEDPNDGVRSERLVHCEGRIPTIQQEPAQIKVNDWENSAFFQAELINQIKTHQSDLLPHLNIENDKALQVW